MNQEKYDELQAKLAAALALVDEVRSVVRETGYTSRRADIRSVANEAIRALTELSDALAADWKRDERELDEEIVGCTAFGDRRPCTEGGLCVFTPDLEYDSTGQTINCEKCGEPP